MACNSCGKNFAQEPNLLRILPCDNIMCIYCMSRNLTYNTIACHKCSRSHEFDPPVREYTESDEDYLIKVLNSFSTPKNIRAQESQSMLLQSKKIEKFLSKYKLHQRCEDHDKEETLYTLKPPALICNSCDLSEGTETYPIPQMVVYLTKTIEQMRSIHEQKLAIFDEMQQYTIKHGANQSLENLNTQFDRIINIIEQEYIAGMDKYRSIKDSVAKNNSDIESQLAKDISYEENALNILQDFESLPDDDLNFLSFFELESTFLSNNIVPRRRDYKSDMKTVSGISHDRSKELQLFIQNSINIVNSGETDFVIVPKFSS